MVAAAVMILAAVVVPVLSGCAESPDQKLFSAAGNGTPGEAGPGEIRRNPREKGAERALDGGKPVFISEFWIRNCLLYANIRTLRGIIDNRSHHLSRNVTRPYLWMLYIALCAQLLVFLVFRPLSRRTGMLLMILHLFLLFSSTFVVMISEFDSGPGSPLAINTIAFLILIGMNTSPQSWKGAVVWCIIVLAASVFCGVAFIHTCLVS